MKKNRTINYWLAALACTFAVGLLLAAPPAGAQTPGTCPDDFCDSPDDSICDPGGFKITLLDFTSASETQTGFAQYVYEICSPAAGVCEGGIGLRAGEECGDNSFCRKKGNQTDPGASCNRDCAVDDFHGLSHFDIFFPELGDACLPEGTQVKGTCACVKGSNTSQCTVKGDIVIGDGSCPGKPANVAKCDDVNEMAPGDCITMTLEIAGELNKPGLGAAVVVSKESQDCNESCLLGPACDDDICEPDEPIGDECLTRTRGFWGTHPHIASQFLPVTVCGKQLNGTAPLTCSSSEALCTSSSDRKTNPPYLALAAQLTAAKLNLKATKALTSGQGTCNAFVHQGWTIQQWITHCEANFCSANKNAISGSGCIEALDAFNNSQDTGFLVTPPPFHAPGPANPTQCQAARGNGFWVGGSCP